MTVVTFGAHSFDTDKLKGRGFLTPYQINGVTYEYETAMRVAASLDIAARAAQVGGVATDVAADRQATAASAAAAAQALTDQAAANTAATAAAAALRDQSQAAATAAAQSALTAAGLVQVRQPGDVAGIPPNLDFPFSSPMAVPPGFVAGSSGKWVMGPAGLLAWVSAGTAPIEYDPLAGGLRGLLSEEARTTLVLWSRRMDDAAWIKTGITPSATVGADGLVGTATRLTATATNGTCLQANTSASAARRFAPYIRRITGTGPVQLTLDGGATWTTVTPTTSYARYGVGQTLANPIVGIRLGTAGDQIDVDFASGETGSSDTSPLESGNALCTRAADVNALALSAVPGWSAMEGTIYIEADAPLSDVYPNLFSLDDGGTSNRIRVNGNPGTGALTAQVTTGGVVQTQVGIGSMTPGATFRIAIAWRAGTLAASLNGSAAVTAGLATVPAMAYLRLWANNGHIRRIMLWSRYLSPVVLPIMTAP